MIVKVYTHREAPPSLLTRFRVFLRVLLNLNEPDDVCYLPPLVHELLVLDLPESVAKPVAVLFFENGGGDTSAHVDTVRELGL